MIRHGVMLLQLRIKPTKFNNYYLNRDNRIKNIELQYKGSPHEVSLKLILGNYALCVGGHPHIHCSFGVCIQNSN